MFDNEACEAPKSAVEVNEQFWGKRNEVSGHYGQTLFKPSNI
jgi:hypothetical protein